MVTLKDIARETGLKVETVSRILNNRGYISDAARARVAEACVRLNYRPNELARSLSRSATSIIGLIVPHVDHPYFAELISALEDEASARGQQLFLFCSRDKEQKIREYFEACMRYRARGVLLCSAAVRADALAGFDIPVVTIECAVEGALASILCDNREGGRLAAEHLISKGCRRLAHISGVRDQPMPADARCAGFLQACEAAGVAHVEYLQDDQAYRQMDYYALIHRLFDEHPDTDGVFTSSDLAAAQVLQVCAARGLRVPADIRLVGFDDVHAASLSVPALTTIAQPVRKMAATAIARLLEPPRQKGLTTSLPVTLVVRETT